MKENAYLEILDATARIIEEEGFNKTTHRAIAERVGIKPASIYYHFRTKDELLYKLLENTITQLMERQRKALQKASGLREKLRALVACELASFVNKRRAQSLDALIHEWRYLSRENQQKLLTLRAEYESNWEEVLHACKSDGLMSADPKITRRILNGALAWSNYWYREGEALSIDQIVDEVIKLVAPV